MAATRKAKPPASRGPGRPRRSDGHAHNSEAAYAARGLGRLALRLPLGTLALLDEIAAAWRCSRGAVIVRALSICLAADGGIVARDLRPVKRGKSQ